MMLPGTIPAKIEQIRIRHLNFIKGLITAFYVAGLIGLSVPELRPYFQLLVPFHLLTNLILMLIFHKDWSREFLFFAAFAFVVGFGSEVMGVHTGFPFGNYSYGPVLGIQLWDVPLMIGINWLLLVYATAALASRFFNHRLAAAVAGALLMVGIDFFIEPVAPLLDFWTWQNDLIPLSNYIGWFGVAFIIHLVYQLLPIAKKNPVALHLLLNLTLFFLLMNFLNN
jgi:uncharacterized membrane protein